MQSIDSSNLTEALLISHLIRSIIGRGLILQIQRRSSDTADQRRGTKCIALLRPFCSRLLGMTGYSNAAPRPCGYCFSHSLPLKGVTVSCSIVPSSRQRTLTLNPSGCERGT